MPEATKEVQEHQSHGDKRRLAIWSRGWDIEMGFRMRVSQNDASKRCDSDRRVNNAKHTHMPQVGPHTSKSRKTSNWTGSSPRLWPPDRRAEHGWPPGCHGRGLHRVIGDRNAPCGCWFGLPSGGQWEKFGCKALLAGTLMGAGVRPPQSSIVNWPTRALNGHNQRCGRDAGRCKSLAQSATSLQAFQS